MAKATNIKVDHVEYTADGGLSWTLDVEEAKEQAGKNGTVLQREVYFSGLEEVQE